jgi:secretion/DNA translocation related CpaE-like protein
MPPSYAAFSGPSGSPQPTLLLTRDAALVAVLQRLAAVAGADLDVRPEPPNLGRWAAPGLVIVGADVVAAVASALPRRSGVVVLGLEGAAGQAPTDTDVWRHAVELGAERVAFLPNGQDWVVDVLAESLEGPQRASVVAVVGGSGGSGASVLATALAVGAARRGGTLLVDLDPLGGGLDLLLGAEDSAGLRWSELAGARGRLGGGMLRDALPQLDGLSLLSWGREEPAPVPADAAAAIADAALRGFDLVVLDLPRSAELMPPEWLRLVSIGLVVVPANVRSVSSAARVLAWLDPAVADLRAVVRGTAGGGLPAEVVADSLGLPLLGELKPEPGLAAAIERGEPPGLRPRGPLARLAARLLDELPPGGVAA